VIIPVYDDPVRLRICLGALETQSYPAERYEVVVVDNGSAQSPAEVVAEHRHARLVSEPLRGSYQARNAGILACRGEVVAFTDSDCIPSAGWLQEGVRALRQTPGCGLVAGRVQLVARDPGRPTLAEAYNIATGFDQKAYVEQMHFGATANLFTWRSVIGRVGLMDGELLSGGDNEWGQRVHGAGYTQAYSDLAWVAHPARASLGALCRKHLRVLWGQHCLARRLPPGPRPGTLSTLHGLFVRPVTRVWGHGELRRRLRLRLAAVALILGAFRGAVMLWLRLGRAPWDIKKHWR
jgi:glycosyltransferase involved in cell wall biosynthesis